MKQKITKQTLLLILALICSFGQLVQSQTEIQWEQNYGGNNGEGLGSVVATNDGGFLLGGYIHSIDANNYGSFDRWIVKIDESGNIEWEQNYGGIGFNGVNSIIAIEEGGYFLGGASISNFGDSDYWVVKIDDIGNIEWEENYGGNDNESLNSMIATDDGGFLLGGSSESNEDDVGGNNGGVDYWIVKIDDMGNIEWEENYGGSGDDLFSSIISYEDGFLIGGYTYSTAGSDVGDNNGSSDYWVVKIDDMGNIEWEENYGGNGQEQLSSIVAHENGLFLVGSSKSNNDDVGDNNGNFDYWIVKIDELGNIEWEENYGGSGYEYATSMVLHPQGGFLLSGYSNSDDGNVGNNNGNLDFWILKINDLGNIEWEQNFGGSNFEYLKTVLKACDGGFILAGSSSSDDGDVDNNNGDTDLWILKIRGVEQSITIKPFFDENENGSLDVQEQILGNISFTINPSPVANAYTNGTQTFFVNSDTYILFNSDALWQTNATENYIVEVPDLLDTTLLIPVTPIADFTIQNIDLTSSITRCNQNTNYWLTYTNTGTVTTDGYVELIPDESTTLTNANPPVDSTADGKLYWFYENLFPTHSEEIHLRFEMPGVNNLGESIAFEANIETYEGFGDHKATLSSELICAYDPNDKLVTPAGVGTENYTLFGDTLEYTIRFQNTGNDTAFSVIIEDELSEHLDLATFRPIASSHNVESKIEIDSRIATFTFNDIYLPDSFVNEPGSHGFVKFQIQGNEGLEQFTAIDNTAEIFFDANPAIVTNTVLNTFSESIPSVFLGKVFLEGCYTENQTMSTDLTEWLPLNQPFDLAPYNYQGSETLPSIPDDMVDWVLVEARTGTPNLSGQSGTSVLERRAGILLNDGTIVNTNGTTGIRFLTLEEGQPYHFSIRHLNHLDVLSANALNADLEMPYDFSLSPEMAFGSEQQKLSNDGTPLLFSGDANGDGIILNTDYDLWFLNNAVLNTYSPTDWNLDGTIQVTDYDLWFLNKAKVGSIEIQY